MCTLCRCLREPKASAEDLKVHRSASHLRVVLFLVYRGEVVAVGQLAQIL